MINLLDTPLQKARDLIATGAPVWLSINPVEFHGPHLSLHNDALISRGLIHDMHAWLQKENPSWPLLFGGELELGVDPVPDVGSRPVSYSHARTLILTACRSMVALGAKRVGLVTFHGSPLHNLAIDAGVKYLSSQGVYAFAPMPILLAKLLAGDTSELNDAYDLLPPGEEREAMRRGAALDFHAGFFETSLSLHYAPNSVHGHTEVPPCPPILPVPLVAGLAGLCRKMGREATARELSFLASALGWYALKPFPGYTGRPHLASAAAGAVIAPKIVEQGALCAQDVFAGRAKSPEPVLKWLVPLTFGGRIGSPHTN